MDKLDRYYDFLANPGASPPRPLRPPTALPRCQTPLVCAPSPLIPPRTLARNPFPAGHVQSTGQPLTLPRAHRIAQVLPLPHLQRHERLGRGARGGAAAQAEDHLPDRHSQRCSRRRHERCCQAARRSHQQRRCHRRRRCPSRQRHRRPRAAAAAAARAAAAAPVRWQAAPRTRRPVRRASAPQLRRRRRRQPRGRQRRRRRRRMTSSLTSTRTDSDMSSTHGVIDTSHNPYLDAQ